MVLIESFWMYYSLFGFRSNVFFRNVVVLNYSVLLDIWISNQLFWKRKYNYSIDLRVKNWAANRDGWIASWLWLEAFHFSIVTITTSVYKVSHTLKVPALLLLKYMHEVVPLLQKVSKKLYYFHNWSRDYLASFCGLWLYSWPCSCLASFLIHSIRILLQSR